VAAPRAPALTMAGACALGNSRPRRARALADLTCFTCRR
jgi:hypothetical protein